MATRVEEAYSERDEAIDAKGNVTEVEIPYLVFDVRDESEALAAVRGNHKAVSGMSLASVETVERVNGDTWKVKAVYEADEDGGGGEPGLSAGWHEGTEPKAGGGEVTFRFTKPKGSDAEGSDVSVSFEKYVCGDETDAACLGSAAVAE